MLALDVRRATKASSPREGPNGRVTLGAASLYR